MAFRSTPIRLSVKAASLSETDQDRRFTRFCELLLTIKRRIDAANQQPAKKKPLESGDNQNS